MKEEIAQLKLKQPQSKRVRLMKPSQPLTYQQKEALCAQISLLESSDLPGLLEIIHPERTGVVCNSFCSLLQLTVVFYLILIPL